VFNRSFLARGVEEGVAAEDLFSLGERAVGDRDLAAGIFVHADACGAKSRPLGQLTDLQGLKLHGGPPADALGKSGYDGMVRPHVT
jgi:hypothetical protein